MASRAGAFAARREMWKYFGYNADGEGKATDIQTVKESPLTYRWERKAH